MTYYHAPVNSESLTTDQQVYLTFRMHYLTSKPESVYMRENNISCSLTNQIIFHIYRRKICGNRLVYQEVANLRNQRHKLGSCHVL